MTETWKRVKDFPDYEVSDLGRVRSWRPLNKSRYAPKKPRMLRFTPATNGRNTVQLYNPGQPGVKTTCTVSRLVAAAFVERGSVLPDKVKHLDGNLKNDKSENLRWY